MLQQQEHMTCKGCMVPLRCAPFHQLIVAVELSVDLEVDHNSVDRMVLVGANIPGLTFLIRVRRTWSYSNLGPNLGLLIESWSVSEWPPNPVSGLTLVIWMSSGSFKNWTERKFLANRSGPTWTVQGGFPDVPVNVNGLYRDSLCHRRISTFSVFLNSPWRLTFVFVFEKSHLTEKKKIQKKISRVLEFIEGVLFGYRQVCQLFYRGFQGVL